MNDDNHQADVTNKEWSEKCAALIRVEQELTAEKERCKRLAVIAMDSEHTLAELGHGEAVHGQEEGAARYAAHLAVELAAERELRQFREGALAEYKKANAGNEELLAERYELFKGMQSELAAEKEARQRAETKIAVLDNVIAKVRAIADREYARANAAEAHRDRLLAIEREARALVKCFSSWDRERGVWVQVSDGIYRHCVKALAEALETK